MSDKSLELQEMEMMKDFGIMECKLDILKIIQSEPADKVISEVLKYLNGERK